MKTCGNLIRIFAIIIMILFTVMIFAQYAISAENLEENRKDLEERIEEHEETHESKADEKDCTQCESFKDSQKSYERNATSLVISAIQSLLVYMTYCCILFGIGVLISKPIVKAAPVQQQQAAPVQQPVPAVQQEVPAPQPQAPAVVYCPKCGAQQQAGNYFCSTCGTPVQR